MMKKEKETLVIVENISKKFSKNLKTSLKYGAIDIFRSTLGLKKNNTLREDEFWAIKDISFTLKRGECIGLIGHNGAGKSTLLKILNGLYAPDKGKITMKGKIGALIELGAGFNPILSGRENIYNNASILGFSKEEVDEKMENIIDFSEIEEFLDMPVKNYSSGMKVRLGFAIAAHLEPDILIIDEVLAVGDLGFVLKCFKKIDELLPKTAVIFVSHNMNQISRICNQIILMDHGEVEYQGNIVSKGIDLYYNKFSKGEVSEVFNDGTYQLLDYSCSLGETSLNRHEDFKIKLKIKIKEPKINIFPSIYLEIKDKDLRPVAGIINKDNNTIVPHDQKTIDIEFTIKNSLFTLGKYTIDLGFSHPKDLHPMLRINNLLSFSVDGEKSLWVPFELEYDKEINIS